MMKKQCKSERFRYECAVNKRELIVLASSVCGQWAGWLAGERAFNRVESIFVFTGNKVENSCWFLC